MTTSLTMSQQSARTFLLLTVLLSASSVPSVEAVFGIPDFLEFGTCANVTLMENFDPVKYTGLWFDIESVPNEYQLTKACVSHKYSWKDDHMNVVSRGLSQDDQKIRVSLAFLPDEEHLPQDPARMKVIAEGTPESPYLVIDTDYRTFSCVYSCLEYFSFRAEFFWLFGRTPTLPEHTANRCHERLTAMGIDYTKMAVIRQGETCPYNKKLEQLLKNNNQLMDRTLGPELPREIVTTPATTNPPATNPATTRPPTTTPATTRPPATTPATTRLPTTTPTTTRPPTTTPAATRPPTTTPRTTDPPTTTPATTRPPTTTAAASSPPSVAESVPSSITITTTARRPRPSFTITSGRAAQGILPDTTEEDMDEQSGEEKITASRQQTVYSNAKEVTPSGEAWKQEQATQGSTAGMTSGVGPMAILMPLLEIWVVTMTCMMAL
ncbi:uncharacterized protein [Panulirus ornatus]|uniref:uncharacterized protein n=1 Tax=Panulirus ornatus TaxID=150431 RepID=UPI003A85FA6D